MIDSILLRIFIEDQLADTEMFLVEAKVNTGNEIEVVVDSDSPISIDQCEWLTHRIEDEFDRDVEDYTLEVGSAGLTSPLKVLRQYKKYIGYEVEVLTKDGEKFTGTLKSANVDNFTIVSKEKVKKVDSKRPVVEDVEHTFPYNEVKQTKYLLKF